MSKLTACLDDEMWKLQSHGNGVAPFLMEWSLCHRWILVVVRSSRVTLSCPVAANSVGKVSACRHDMSLDEFDSRIALRSSRNSDLRLTTSGQVPEPKTSLAESNGSNISKILFLNYHQIEKQLETVLVHHWMNNCWKICGDLMDISWFDDVVWCNFFKNM